MAKKLNLKIPPVSEGGIDVILIVLGIGAIAYALYLGGVFNGPGTVIEASDRFTRKNQSSGNDESGNGDTAK